MWATSLLTIMLLFPLLSAAPLDIAGGVEDDNDVLHSHDDNVTRRGKQFDHNQFDFSVNVQGDVDWIGHEVNIDVHSHADDHHHHEDDTVIECKKGLRMLFKSIDSNNNGIIDAKELLRVCHQNNFQVTESSAVRILTLPDKTVGFNLAKFCELLKDCPSTNRADLIYFLLELFDKVTCPHKDDLSDVLLENHWRTQNQINAMSENMQRNTVIAEVEKMTDHTIEDLQGRANAGNLGSLTAIANMAGFLINHSIKSSSDVETMTYSDLRNTLIVEANQRFLIEVSILQSMTDRQLLKAFCTGCEVLVGKSTSNTISATVTEGCVCPTVVNKDNWLGDGTYPEEFKVTQDGSSLQVQRTDSDIGWSMDLSFMCKRGKVQFPLEECLDMCQSNTCQNDRNVREGCNQMFSCAHGCKLLQIGLERGVCRDLCDRNGQSGCSPNVGGWKFDLCQDCNRGGCTKWPQVEECKLGCNFYNAVCPADVEVTKDCMCAGISCATGSTCVGGSTCTAVCPADVEVTKDCMCAGISCATGSTCVGGSTCTEANICTSDNGACIFPFTAHGKTYNRCTMVNHNQAWCATKEDQTGNWWGNCPSTCEMSVTCGGPATLLSTSLGSDMALCKDETETTCEKDFESLCPAGWNLCTPGQFNNRNDNWLYNWNDANVGNPLGAIYCEVADGPAYHYSLSEHVFNIDEPFNCDWSGSSRPGCDQEFGAATSCDDKSQSALCCAPTSTCGDGEVQEEEDCDDGNNNDMDDCLNTCTRKFRPNLCT